MTQFGPTIEVFRRPKDLVTARTFADPPLNTVTLRKEGDSFQLDGGTMPVPSGMEGLPEGNYAIGFQPHHLRATRPSADAIALPARVLVTEITGSESFVHVQFADQRWVMLASGIHIYQPEEMIEVFVDPRHLMLFDHDGRTVQTARQATVQGGGNGAH